MWRVKGRRDRHKWEWSERASIVALATIEGLKVGSTGIDKKSFTNGRQ